MRGWKIDVEDGDALRVVELAHRIVAALDAPDQAGAAVLAAAAARPGRGVVKRS